MEVVRSTLSLICGGVGERRQRAQQLWRWMYHDKFWARSIDATADLQDGFGAAYRQGPLSGSPPIDTHLAGSIYIIYISSKECNHGARVRRQDFLLQSRFASPDTQSAGVCSSLKVPPPGQIPHRADKIQLYFQLVLVNRVSITSLGHHKA